MSLICYIYGVSFLQNYINNSIYIYVFLRKLEVFIKLFNIVHALM